MKVLPEKMSGKDLQEMQSQTKERQAQVLAWAKLSPTELKATLGTPDEGLGPDQVEELQEEHGENIIPANQPETRWHRLYEATVNPFNVVLFVIAIISFFTDVILSSRPDYVTVSIILFLIILSSGLSFFQNERSSKAAEELTGMVSNSATVKRQGVYQEIPMKEIVPGDLVKLSAGDMLPADLRFLKTKDLFIAQAALTGESAPVEKFVDLKNEESQNLADTSNIGLLGTNVISGSAEAIVLYTGAETYFGGMAKSFTAGRAETSFERGVKNISKLLIRMMLLLIPAVFLINGLTKGNWGEALLFAVTIAVGLTPQLLPMIMTSSLAIGALNMSKHQVIVRHMSTIQTFGEMDVLCTDKTGTLTEDKIVLEKYLDMEGQENMRILRHAYLNSYFQTGLKNLIDVAIIQRAEINGIGHMQESYHLVDEIPFDFSRRRMSVVVEDTNGKRQLITKGAVEEMLRVCTHVQVEDQVQVLDEAMLAKAQAVYTKYNNEGLRMLAVAQKNIVTPQDTFSLADEDNLVLIGFVGFLDPPKASAKQAIQALQDHGVRTVVLTGDGEGVAQMVCSKVGVDCGQVITGTQVEAMSDPELLQAVETCDLFAKLSPDQKKRIVIALQKNHTVGFMGDGINDAPALTQADVGISVDTAVDIAKETADIILLKKDLMVLEEGVLCGRTTFGNINKYLKMATSGNLGNMISVLFASIFLPFLPMIPVQILTQNLLNDFAQLGMPFDQMDAEYLQAPKKWDTKSLQRFMFWLGPLSTVFDLIAFAVFWFVFGANRMELAPLFQAGWFVFGTISQIMIINVIRTRKVPFLQSRPAKPLIISSVLVAIIVCVIGFTKLATGLDMMQLPVATIPWFILLLGGYFAATQVVKELYIKKYKEWI